VTRGRSTLPRTARFQLAGRRQYTCATDQRAHSSKVEASNDSGECSSVRRPGHRRRIVPRPAPASAPVRDRDALGAHPWIRGEHQYASWSMARGPRPGGVPAAPKARAVTSTTATPTSGTGRSASSSSAPHAASTSAQRPRRPGVQRHVGRARLQHAQQRGHRQHGALHQQTDPGLRAHPAPGQSRPPRPTARPAPHKKRTPRHQHPHPHRPAPPPPASPAPAGRTPPPGARRHLHRRVVQLPHQEPRSARPGKPIGPHPSVRRGNHCFQQPHQPPREPAPPTPGRRGPPRIRAAVQAVRTVLDTVTRPASAR